MTKIDLDSVLDASPYDSPIVGRSKCCRMKALGGFVFADGFEQGTTRAWSTPRAS